MSLQADIQYTVLKADQVYTSALTPVSAVPWNQRGDPRTFPIIPVDYDRSSVVWDFGDGTTYTGVSAQHIYTWPGTYEISMYIINSSGEPVKSTVTDTVTVLDFVSTQFEYTTVKDIIDIPSGSVVNPIQLNFVLSWQNYTIPARQAPLCDSGKQHWMNGGTSPGYWMCGDTHTGAENPPVYTFSLYASGSNAQPVDTRAYQKDKYAHLTPSWYFTSAQPTLTSTPITSLDVTMLDTLTGTTGDYNTYEPLYYSYIDNEFQQVTADTPGSVFVGVSGNATFYYVDDKPKAKTSNDTSVIINTQLDSIKLHDSQTIRGENLPLVKHNNVKNNTLANIKPRINLPAKLGVTCNGLNDFQIGKNKWVNGETLFTITVQDSTGFNILDSTVINDTNMSLSLKDQFGNDVASDLYDITHIQDAAMGYYQGSININTPMDDVSVHGTLTYTPASGYTSDAIVAWYNSYSATDTYGETHRVYYAENYEYDNSKLTNNITTSFTKSSTNIKTSGIVSDITLTDGGSSMLARPNAEMTGPGEGAVLECVYDDTVKNITAVNVLSGGVGYDSTSTVDFEVFPVAATKPTVNTITLENNYQTTLAAVALEDPNVSQHAWLLETGLSPRLVRADTRNIVNTTDITDYDASSTGANSIMLDSTKNVWILTDNRLLNINHADASLLNSYNITGTCLEIDTENVYVGHTTSITKSLISTPDVPADTYNASSNIVSILYTNTQTLYVLKSNNEIDIVDATTMSRVSTVTLPSGSYTQLTTTIDNNVYTSSSTGILYRITPGSSMEILYDNSVSAPNIASICGDSRGYLWMSDTANKRIWIIDGENTTSSDLQVNNDITTLKKSNINYTNYPSGFSGDHQLVSVGDHTGFHWLQKYGYQKQIPVTLTGASATFNVHSASGKYQIRKQNEEHDHKNMLKSYALQPWLQDNYNLWENTVSYALGDSDSLPTQIGKLYHEKIANFVNNNSDIDDSNIDSIHSDTLLYQVPIQTYTLDFPPSFARLFNIISIKHKRLYGEFDQLTDNFDQFTDYTNPLRENLGEEIDVENYTLTVGETIVALEKFSKKYTKIEIPLPTTGTTDNYNNIVGLTTDMSILTGNTYDFKHYNVYWNWGLVAPATTTGTDITNYYGFYKYNPTVNLPQAEGVINWNDPQNTLDSTDQTYASWSDDTGVMDNMIEHQLRTGLGII